jgi:phosphatidylglycerol:prolipoprotein diacylglycerol transferase
MVRLARLPAVIHGSWAAFIVAGLLVGLALQGAILAPEGISIGQSLAVSLLAVVSGLVGAKLWFIAQHPRSWRTSPGEGWSVNGFLAGTPVVGVAALLSFGLPIGVFLDATAPALFFGVAIGRLGCFFTGCCAGRCTSSRWGVWSSDRRVGARRIPTQLLESLGGLVIGITTLLLVLLHASPIGGGIFVAGMATYVLLRHVLLQLRAEPHRPTLRTQLTAAFAALVLLADATILLLWPAT